jgi:hypothetical protein
MFSCFFHVCDGYVGLEQSLATLVLCQVMAGNGPGHMYLTDMSLPSFVCSFILLVQLPVIHGLLPLITEAYVYCIL